MSAPIKALLYLVSLYAWWCLCAYFFEVDIPPPPQQLRQPQARATFADPPAGHAAAQSMASTATTATAVQPAAVAIPGVERPSHIIKCPPNRRPFHTLLTTQGTVYNQWQARIMYHHWLKQREIDGPCTEMSNFTRLCPSPQGEPDGVEKFIPTIFVKQLTTDVLAKYGHFGVLNRPHSVMEFFKNPELRARAIKEEYVLIAETDHVLMKPMPNLATPTEAAAHAFGYMHAGAHHQKVIELCDPSGSWRDLQPVGPSPLIIKMSDLERVTPRWLEYSYKLRGDPMPARSSSKTGSLRCGDTPSPPPRSACVTRSFRLSDRTQRVRAHDGRLPQDFYIFHYTYGIEYTLQGQPAGLQHDRRVVDGQAALRGLVPAAQPRPAARGRQPVHAWLWNAWNTAINEAGKTWPETNAMGTVGWRRESISASEIPSRSWRGGCGHQMAVGQHPLARPSATRRAQDAVGHRQVGARHESQGPAQVCAGAAECLFVDFSGAAHHVSSELPDRFTSVRVGDGEVVKGERIH